MYQRAREAQHLSRAGARARTDRTQPSQRTYRSGPVPQAKDPALADFQRRLEQLKDQAGFSIRLLAMITRIPQSTLLHAFRRNRIPKGHVVAAIAKRAKQALRTHACPASSLNGSFGSYRAVAVVWVQDDRDRRRYAAVCAPWCAPPRCSSSAQAYRNQLGASGWTWSLLHNPEQAHSGDRRALHRAIRRWTARSSRCSMPRLASRTSGAWTPAPRLVVGELHSGRYVERTTALAGTTTHIGAPFPADLDPGALTQQRHTRWPMSGSHAGYGRLLSPGPSAPRTG